MRRTATLLYALAVAMPLVALVVAGGASRWPHGLALAPFGWLSVAAVHLIASVPLAVGIALALRGGLLPNMNSRALRAWHIAWLAAALATLWAAIVLLPSIATGQGMARADEARYFALRCCWSLALVLPWCGLAVGCIALGKPPAPRVRPWPAIALAALAIIVPWAYFRHVTRTQTTSAEEHLAAGKYAAAQAAILGLCDLGSERTIAGEQPQRVAGWLSERTEEYLATIAEPLSSGAALEERINRARWHAQFGQLGAARECVVDFAESSSEAALLMAAAWQDEGLYAESTRYYELARRLAGPNDPEAMRRAIDGLAFNARAVGYHARAVEHYETSLRELPAEAAHFHFQLAQHYQLAGRPWQAAEHFQAATQLDPVRFAPPAQAKLGGLLTSTPFCLPWPW